MLLAFFLVWYHDVTIRLGSPETVPCLEAMLLLLRKVCYIKIVRPRSDQGLRCTKTKVKRLRNEH